MLKPNVKLFLSHLYGISCHQVWSRTSGIHPSPNQCAFQVSLSLSPSSQSGLFPITFPILLFPHQSVRLLRQVYYPGIRPSLNPFPFPPPPTQSRPLSQGMFLLGLLPPAPTQLTWHCGAAQCEFCLPPHMEAQHLSSGLKYQASHQHFHATVLLF